MHRLLPLLLIAALVPGPVWADGERGVGAFYDSSMLAWVDAVARALIPRLEGTDAVSLEVAAEAGLDERKAKRVFVDQLTRRLLQDGVSVKDPGGATIHLSLTLSLPSSDAWAVGLLTGDVEGAVAVSWPVDRELEALLAAPRARLGQGRWALERLGTVPSGTLDLVLLDLDDRDGDEIALLGVEGLRTLRFDDGNGRPTPLGGPWPLGPEPHERFAVGWLGVLDDGLGGASSSWSAIAIDPRTGARMRGPATVLLQQPRDAAHPRSLAAVPAGGADLTLLVPEAGLPSTLEDAPARLRDVQLWPGADAAVWVGHDGRLGGVAPDGAPFSAPASTVGDRIVLGDLDADGRTDLAVTEPSAPDEGDRLSVFRLDADGAPLIFQAAFDGSITALASGDLDFDGQPDLIVVEESGGPHAVLWRLERRR